MRAPEIEEDENQSIVEPAASSTPNQSVYCSDDEKIIEFEQTPAFEVEKIIEYEEIPAIEGEKVVVPEVSWTINVFSSEAPAHKVDEAIKFEDAPAVETANIIEFVEVPEFKDEEEDKSIEGEVKAPTIMIKKRRKSSINISYNPEKIVVLANETIVPTKKYISPVEMSHNKQKKRRSSSSTEESTKTRTTILDSKQKMVRTKPLLQTDGSTDKAFLKAYETPDNYKKLQKLVQQNSKSSTSCNMKMVALFVTISEFDNLNLLKMKNKKGNQLDMTVKGTLLHRLIKDMGILRQPGSKTREEKRTLAHAFAGAKRFMKNQKDEIKKFLE